MGYRFDFRPYERRFRRSLSTHYGNWEIRDGIILRLMDEEGRVGWGEVAPIPWFGSETLEQALSFCHQLPVEITSGTIFSIPSYLPACQFGFESAWESLLTSSTERNKPLKLSALLPAGKTVLEAWKPLWNQGYQTFKWKISVYPVAEEIEIFQQLIQALPPSSNLRLDANGGLNSKTASLWLKTCDSVSSIKIEFLEQPFPIELFEEMLELKSHYSTQIALDESVATLERLEACYQQGWRGIFVIKPGIMGSPKRLRSFYKEHKVDLVFSSVFETMIGRKAALKLAEDLSHNNRAVGFGVESWFVENDKNWLEDLWKKY